MITTSPSPLPWVSVEDLHAAICLPDVAILDATYFPPGMGESGIQVFRREHIPGAAFFDVDAIADRRSALPHMLPSPEEFATAVGALGVGSAMDIAVYDSRGLFSAARVWWMFRAFGHDRVWVVDGGLPAWKRAGFATEPGEAAPRAPRHFEPVFRPSLVRSLEEVALASATGAEQLVDARSPGRFSGDEAELWAGRRSGHVPQSRNVPFTDLVDAATGRLLPLPALQERFERAGLDLSRPITASCGSGVTACILALALHGLGHPDVAVYDGSWAEWGLPGPTPVELGAPRP